MNDKSISGVKDKSGELMSEGARRCVACGAMWLGWLGGLGMFIHAVFSYDPSEGRFAPQWVSFSFFLLLFIAVAGTLVRSRMRLSDTIIAALKTGADLNRKETDMIIRHVNRRTDDGSN